MIKQKALFNESYRIAERVKSLSCFVQNDIDKMLEDGHITKEDIIKARQDAREQYNNAIKALYNHRNEVLEFLDDKIICAT